MARSGHPRTRTAGIVGGIVGLLAAGNRAPVLAGGAQRTIAGRVCMDQFVLDVGDAPVRAGDRVVLWGAGTDGEPTAQQWADACDTIHYELVARIGGRFARRHVGSAGAV